MFTKADRKALADLSSLASNLLIGQQYTNTLLKEVIAREEKLQELINKVLAEEGQFMADITQALADLTAAVSNAASELATLKSDLDAAIAANDPTKLQAVADAVEAQVSALNAAAAAANPNPAPPTP